MAYTKRQTPEELDYADVRTWVRTKGLVVLRRVLNDVLGDITDEFKEAVLRGDRLELEDFNDEDMTRRFLRAVRHRLAAEEVYRALPAKK